MPGETILIAAAVYSGAGKLNIVAVGLLAFVAAVLGDNVGYGLGKFGGRALVPIGPVRLPDREASGCG